ncbi:MAG: hypothetical protein Q8S31_00835 [Alphaproteobacteria bacterium]|nr:hypothetical protein [Alphaproteobacteria bacterium]
MKKNLSIAFVAFSLTFFSTHASKVEYDDNGRVKVNEYTCDLALGVLVSNTNLIEEYQSRTDFGKFKDIKKAEQAIESIRPLLKLCTKKGFIRE